MRRLLLMAVIAVTVLPTQLRAASKSYDVSPYGSCVAEVDVADHNVTQFLINTLDSLETASVWVGDTLSSQPYKVEIKDAATGDRVAHNDGFPVHQCWAWLKIPLTEDAKPVRGRTYYVQVSRTGGGGISFAYDPVSLSGV